MEVNFVVIHSCFSFAPRNFFISFLMLPFISLLCVSSIFSMHVWSKCRSYFSLRSQSFHISVFPFFLSLITSALYDLTFFIPSLFLFLTLPSFNFLCFYIFRKRCRDEASAICLLSSSFLPFPFSFFPSLFSFFHFRSLISSAFYIF